MSSELTLPSSKSFFDLSWTEVSSRLVLPAAATPASPLLARSLLPRSHGEAREWTLSLRSGAGETLQYSKTLSYDSSFFVPLAFREFLPRRRKGKVALRVKGRRAPAARARDRERCGRLVLAVVGSDREGEIETRSRIGIG